MSFAKRARDNFFTLNGRSSADWGIVASKDNGFDAPERDVSAIEVPGRNGELHIDNGRWRNIDVTYNDCVIERDFTERFGDFRAYCARQRGYQRLEDTFHPDEYRLADMTQGIKVSSVGTRYNSGKFDLTFNCKPQRFLKSGEEPIILMNWASMSEAQGYENEKYGKASAWIGVTAGTDCILNLTKKDYHESPDITAYITWWKTTQQAGEYEDLIARLRTDSEQVTSTTTFSSHAPSDAEMFLVEIVTEDTDDLSLWDISIDFINENGESIHGIFTDALDIINPTGFETQPLVVSHNQPPIAVFYPGLDFSYQNAAGDFVKKYELTVEYDLASQVAGYGKDVYMDTENQYAYVKKANSSKESGIEYKTYDAIHVVDVATGAWTRIDFPNLCETVTRINYEPSESWVWTLTPAHSDEPQPFEYIANGDTYKAIYPRWYTI